MNADKDKLKEQVALFRHRLIARLVAAHLSPQQRQHEIARIVADAHQIPGSTRTRVAETTLRDWLRAYREGGFEALIPKKRIDAGHPRTLAPEVVERLLQIKEADPDLAIRLVIEQVRKERVIAAEQPLPPATVHRLFVQHGLMGRASANTASAGEDRRRFAFAHAGQLWMSDVMHGPAVIKTGQRKHKTYLIAFLDDATRVIPHAEFAFAENTRAFLPVFKKALIRRGLPERLFVENVSRHIFDIMCPVALCGASPQVADSRQLWSRRRNIT